jgi:site-specific DNA recombinase
MTVKAVIYSRFSTDRQTDSSIADQVRVCTEYAARQRWEILERYEDQGISGAALGNRPGVLNLREAALARRFDVVLVTDLSRLSRSNGDLSTLIDRLVNRNIRVIGVQDGYDSARKGHKMQAGLSGIIGEAFREMVKDRTYTALESRARTQRPTGGKAFGYLGNVVDAEKAVIVQGIFEQFVEGASCRTIAEGLNARATPSPGSTWNRTERRCHGWMGSAVRAMLMNPRYKGEIVWNQSEWRKDPDSGRRVRIERPSSEWIIYRDESQRIVTDELWGAAQRRLRPAPNDVRLKSGGKAKFLLSGLLRCDVCGAHYVMANAFDYQCGSYRDGAACHNGMRVRRDHAQDVLVTPIKDDLLAPERVDRMVGEMEAYYREKLSLHAAKAVEAPRNLSELEARIARLRERLRRGDPDMAPDEIQAALERAESKRRELEEMQPEAVLSYRLPEHLPQAAELYRGQIIAALAGDSRATSKARVMLRELFSGEIRLQPQPDGGLLAYWNLQLGALLRGVGSSGSGGRI